MISIFPPLKIETTFFPSGFKCFKAATVRSPEFSTSILWFSKMSRNATINSSSSMVIISSKFSWRYGKIVSPGVFTAVPSAIVLTPFNVTGCPAFKDSWRQFAPAGSTPMTLIFGFNILARVETPVESPPPPTGTKIISTVGSSFTISIAIEPWPVATSKSSKGWTKVYPCSAANSFAFSQASSYTLPWRTTSAPSSFVRFTFNKGVVVGITTIAGAPNFLAAYATPCAWFPAEAVISPFCLSSSESVLIL